MLRFLLHRLEDAVDLLNLDLMVNPESEFAVQARDLQNVDLAKVNKLIDFVLVGFFSFIMKGTSYQIKLADMTSLFINKYFSFSKSLSIVFSRSFLSL